MHYALQHTSASASTREANAHNAAPTTGEWRGQQLREDGETFALFPMHTTVGSALQNPLRLVTTNRNLWHAPRSNLNLKPCLYEHTR